MAENIVPMSMRSQRNLIKKIWEYNSDLHHEKLLDAARLLTTRMLSIRGLYTTHGLNQNERDRLYDTIIEVSGMGKMSETAWQSGKTTQPLSWQKI